MPSAPISTSARDSLPGMPRNAWDDARMKGRRTGAWRVDGSRMGRRAVGEPVRVDGMTGDAAADVAASAVNTRAVNTIRNMTGVSGEA